MAKAANVILVEGSIPGIKGEKKDKDGKIIKAGKPYTHDGKPRRGARPVFFPTVDAFETDCNAAIDTLVADCAAAIKSGKIVGVCNGAPIDKPVSTLTPQITLDGAALMSMSRRYVYALLRDAYTQVIKDSVEDVLIAKAVPAAGKRGRKAADLSSIETLDA